MGRLIYDFIFIIFLSIFLPVWWLFYRRKGYNIGILERFLIKNPKLPKDAVWIHCASIGEIKTAIPIIDYISSKENVFLTFFSPRAYRFVKDNLNIPATFLPFDISFLIKRFIEIHRPKSLVLVEGEFWLNLVRISSENMPVISINTKLPKHPYLYKHILKKVNLFLLKNPQDEMVLKRVGVNAGIHSCGNLKILSKINEKEIEFFTEKKVILAGSTHWPEEDIILDVFKEMKSENSQLVLVLAPRHIERIDQLQKLVENKGLTYSLRSKTKRADSDVYLIDTIGELSSMYKFADAVFVGGTLANIGGHNIFEPILSGKKVIIGKNFYKIKELVEEAKKLKAIEIVEDRYQLKEAFKSLLEDGNIKVNVRELQEEILRCYKKSIII